ncbi:MAG TPA: type II toxin-antitoxin system RelE/ParE family toxin [Lachnospiraceae bacterium]|nr:type II toxin-antitoxin system RelE/ParE family toxin [Lachnospiraceae bacterium]
MNKYNVKLLARAARDLDEIYTYIVEEFKEPGTAESIATLLEIAILGLVEIPYRGEVRKTGAFANRGYRQLFVKNFIIVYRIDEESRVVIIVTVRYTNSRF